MDSLVQGAIYKENLVQQGHHCGTSIQIQCLHVEAILCWKSYLFNNINNCCNKRKNVSVETEVAADFGIYLVLIFHLAF